MNEVRLLTEQEVTSFRADNFLKVGQCHAVRIGRGVISFCSNERRPYKRTCVEHRTVRGRDLLAAHVAARESR